MLKYSQTVIENLRGEFHFNFFFNLKVSGIKEKENRGRISQRRLFIKINSTPLIETDVSIKEKRN